MGVRCLKLLCSALKAYSIHHCMNALLPIRDSKNALPRGYFQFLCGNDKLIRTVLLF